MRTIGLLLLASVVAFGQRAGVGAGHARPSPFGSVSGFGNVVYPGTGHAPAISFTGGSGGRVGAGVGLGGGRLHGGRSIGSIGYIPWGYSLPLDYTQTVAPAAQPYSPEPPAPPQVVINQYFASETARPVVREYVTDSDGGMRAYDAPRASAAPAPAPAEETPTYLIAFKDHTIYAALAYWVEDDTLHYITNQNTHNQVSLDLIDRDLSNRFNRERNVEFHLPPAR